MARSHTTTKQHKQEGEVVARQQVRPLEPARISLGTYTADNPPIGFSVEFEPAPDPKKSVVTHVTSLGTKKQYRLVCLVDSYSVKPVTVVIRRLNRSHTSRNNTKVWLHDAGNGGCVEVAVKD